jgi:hypothetical protein
MKIRCGNPAISFFLSACLAAPAFAQGAYYPQNQPPPNQGSDQSGQASTGSWVPGMQMPAASQSSPYPAGQSVPAAALSVPQWFARYDEIRHQAQMSPQERQRADALMSRGLSILLPGDEKAATKALLFQMVGRYERACQQLQVLPQLRQTTQLQHYYYRYFAVSRQLFADYLRVQDNLLLTDAVTGQPVATGLIQRKQMLEQFEHQCKTLDSQTRAACGIPPYRW